MDGDWIRIISCSAPFSLLDFEKVMQLLIAEPNIVSPAILRAEVISDTDIESQRTILPNFEIQRTILRKILPKQPEKDCEIIQRICIITENDKMTVEHDALDGFNELQLPEKLPYFYPKFKKFRYVYNDSQVSIDVIPFNGMESLVSEFRMIQIWTRIIKHLHRFGRGMRDGYQKKVHHDLLVPKIAYQDLYYTLKQKYKHWVVDWPEETDPAKFVYEDVSIATWLILLWRGTTSNNPYIKSKKFIDLGCGNGFLTYILTNEGFTGYGIDLARRKIWDSFPGVELIGMLIIFMIERPLLPQDEVFHDVEWIIGNHPDELTLWVPIIAQKSSMA